MPRTNEIKGVYKIANKITNECYVGQSARMKKRVAEHFRLLRLGDHPNYVLQEAFNTHGEDAFYYEFEIICSDLEGMDAIEEAFINGDAWFPERCVYNISNTARTPMEGRKHTEDTKQRIKESVAKYGDMKRSAEFRKKCQDGITAALMANPKWVSDVKFVIENDTMTYAERGRRVGKDTSTTRKLYLKYKHLKGVL